jgi:hypothetical protein
LEKIIIAKSQCYKTTPLKGISPMRFECAGEKLWVMFYEFFMLPGSFIFNVVTPLHLAHLDDPSASDSFYRIQNYDRSLATGQITF